MPRKPKSKTAAAKKAPKSKAKPKGKSRGRGKAGGSKPRQKASQNVSVNVVGGQGGGGGGAGGAGGGGGASAAPMPVPFPYPMHSSFGTYDMGKPTRFNEDPRGEYIRSDFRDKGSQAGISVPRASRGVAPEPEFYGELPRVKTEPMDVERAPPGNPFAQPRDRAAPFGNPFADPGGQALAPALPQQPAPMDDVSVQGLQRPRREKRKVADPPAQGVEEKPRALSTGVALPPAGQNPLLPAPPMAGAVVPRRDTRAELPPGPSSTPVVLVDQGALDRFDKIRKQSPLDMLQNRVAQQMVVEGREKRKALDAVQPQAAREPLRLGPAPLPVSRPTRVREPKEFGPAPPPPPTDRQKRNFQNSDGSPLDVGINLKAQQIAAELSKGVMPKRASRWDTERDGTSTTRAAAERTAATINAAGAAAANIAKGDHALIFFSKPPFISKSIVK